MKVSENRLKDVSTHFSFGKNWRSYAAKLDEQRIDQAASDLDNFLGEGAVQGHSFLDIGCGSGLHSLAALRRGASRVFAMDIDPDSVATTHRVLSAHAADSDWQCARVSVFDLSPSVHGRFGVVYSWGVLHHTGAMYEAVERAACMVDRGGLLALALYRKTLLCPLWKVEKRVYKSAPPSVQRWIQSVFIGSMRTAYRVTGRDFQSMLASYHSARGMDYHHDVHDWLGGYPYESVSPEEAETFVSRLGFEMVKTTASHSRSRIFGLGCDEYLFRRVG